MTYSHHRRKYQAVKAAFALATRMLSANRSITLRMQTNSLLSAETQTETSAKIEALTKSKMLASEHNQMEWDLDLRTLLKQTGIMAYLVYFKETLVLAQATLSHLLQVVSKLFHIFS